MVETTNMNNLFLPENYKKNTAISYDSSKESNYWDPARISTARSYQYSFYQWADKLIKKYKFTDIADVGCGMAYKLDMLYHWNKSIVPTGFDQPNAIELCKKHYQYGEWIGVNFDKNPEVPSKKFDLVISSDVIEHLEHPDNLLNFMKNLVSLDGFILISTPDRDILRNKKCLYSPNKDHVQEWSRREFAQYLESRGFEIIEHRILQAIRPSYSSSYIRKLIKRALKLKTMHYSQAVLLRKI